jgi:hypothetical protein
MSLLVAFAYFTGYDWGKQNVVYVETLTVVEKEKEVQVNRKKNRVTKETVRKPDGTVIERESRTESLTDLREKSSTRIETQIVPNPKADYSLGIQSNYSRELNLSGGRRLFGDIWLDISVPLEKPLEPSLGLSIQF